jgi:hypothetical protein
VPGVACTVAVCLLYSLTAVLPSSFDAWVPPGLLAPFLAHVFADATICLRVASMVLGG